MVKSSEQSNRDPDTMPDKQVFQDFFPSPPPSREVENPSRANRENNKKKMTTDLVNSYRYSRSDLVKSPRLLEFFFDKKHRSEVGFQVQSSKFRGSEVGWFQAFI